MSAWGVAEYFREEDLNDLDTTGQGQSVINFIAANFHRIRSFRRILCRHDHVYNICVINKDNYPIHEILTPFLEQYSCVIRVNLSAGSIALQDNGKLRYITASIDNYLLLRQAFEIRCPSDISKFYEALLKTKALDSEIFKLETSKSRKLFTTNLKFHVFCDHARAQQNGTPPLDMGKWGTHPCVCCLQKNSRAQLYQDNLCVFRAVFCFLKLQENPQYECRSNNIWEVHALYHEYREEKDPQLPLHPIQYKGSYLETLKSLCFFKKINVVVFSDETVTQEEAETYENPSIFDFQGDSTTSLSRILYRYVGGFDKTMHLIDYNNHCILIKPGKLSSVLHQFACRFCSFNTRWQKNLVRHEKICTNIKKITYRSGAFEESKPLFIRSNELHIPFPSGFEEYPYFIVWDIEVSFKTTHITSGATRGEDNTPGTVFTAEHDLLSIALSTNFMHDEIQPVVCFVRQGDSKEDEERVMIQAVEYMLKIQKKVYHHLLSVFEGFLEFLRRAITEEKQFEDELMSRLGMSELDDGDAEHLYENRQVNRKVKLDKSPLVLLMEDVMRWLEQIPILTFNGQRYDINVVKEYLLPKLVQLHGVENVKLLKRGNSYMCITTPTFRFLDIINYVGPGMSLEKFLTSFKAPTAKGRFPYESVKSVADLRHTFCPPIEAFDSVLRGTKLSQAEYHEHVVRPWNDLNMETWGDLLTYYNCSDVAPTLIAVKNYINEFPGTDLFKTFVSISGIAYYELFRTAPPDAKFFRPGEELTKLMRKNLTGGFVSATTRYFKSNVSRLRNANSDLVGGVRQNQENEVQQEGHLVGGIIGKGRYCIYQNI